MPSAKKHLQIEFFFLPLAIFVFYLFRPTILESAVYGSSYIFSSLLLSPDLDLASSQTLKRWGPLRGFWLPYQKIFRHRGLSHNLILGPATRIVYLLFILTLLAWIINYLLIWFEFPGLQFMPAFRVIGNWLLITIIGLYIPNFLHIICDRIYTRFRPLFKKHMVL